MTEMWVCVSTCLLSSGSSNLQQWGNSGKW